MSQQIAFALNRIVNPYLDLEEFFELSSGAGLARVELRNDLSSGLITDNYTPAQVKELSAKYGMKILSINALQKFNVGNLLKDKKQELEKLLQISKAIGCQVVILCPNTDSTDTRTDKEKFTDTVTALKEFAPLFEENDITGLIEPLGFKISSLRSPVTAMKAIKEAGEENYRIVHDTFHHFIGPDTIESLSREYDFSFTALVHISGVEQERSTSDYTDNDRVLVSSEDKTNTTEQIELLKNSGYEGAFSFEPFSEKIQHLHPDQLINAIRKSIDYICKKTGFTQVF